MSGLKTGDRVVIVGSAEAEKHAGKVWMLLYDEWNTANGTGVAKLKCHETGDYYPSYATKFLVKVTNADGSVPGVKKYRKRPVVVEALKFTGENWSEIARFVSSDYERNDDGTFQIMTPEGEHKCSIGDYVIKDVYCEFYLCKPGIFEDTYEAVEDCAQE